MDRFEQAAIVTELIDQMRSRGSWSGETHIQKGTYFLQDLLTVPLGFKFILYKHGPFSFDLRDALAAMRADQFIEVDVQPYPYGPRLISTESSRAFRTQFKDLVGRFLPRLELVAQRLRDSRVADLERYATALYVLRESGGSEGERAENITKLKPHVSVPDAIEAVRFVDEFANAAGPIMLHVA